MTSSKRIRLGGNLQSGVLFSGEYESVVTADSRTATLVRSPEKKKQQQRLTTG